MQDNAAQDIRQNKIFRGTCPRTPPPLAKLRAYGADLYGLYCIGQILGLDPALKLFIIFSTFHDFGPFKKFGSTFRTPPP